ncbi:SET domain-containing protein 5 [Lunasporangiospora selenospora]|uniref:Histone-lysine N-methyltransferase SET5 n=1 Tax=Lunasporangiospora selenospora TaxID=979761 RepID=A0A9P6FTM8_9FUNG|nr:SET domain-containing protein 5 [Lunasporangiospora selenospora]
MSAQVTPEAPVLTALISKIKTADPSLGIKKVLAEIQSQEPTWLVSEKRVKKLMAEAGIAVAKVELEVNDPSIPVSHIDTDVDVSTLTNGLVKAKMINKIIGKGLFAAQDIPKGKILFTEFPFIYFPPMKRFNMIRKGEACGLCARTIKYGSVLICVCPACNKVKYCTKACRQTAWDSSHKMECSALNPALKEYIDYCVEENWNAGMGALRSYERILLANETSAQELDSVLKHFDAFATVSQEERQRKETSWDMMGDQSRMVWEKALELLIKGCQYPLKVTPKSGVSVLTKPLPDRLKDSLFTMDAFLKTVGRYNINNQDGGLYLLHSSLNHACAPNSVIDHPGAGTNYGVSVRLARDVKRDEQLQITYCDPRWGRDTRQQYLRTEYLFTCKCKRCTGSDDQLSIEIKQSLGLE